MLKLAPFDRWARSDRGMVFDTDGPWVNHAEALGRLTEARSDVEELFGMQERALALITKQQRLMDVMDAERSLMMQEIRELKLTLNRMRSGG